MPYYHVIIETTDKVGKSGSFEKLYDYDKTNLDEIINNYVVPYVASKDIHFKGYFIQKNKIRRFAIKETIQDINSIKTIKQNKVPGNVLFIYTNDNIVEDDKLAKDITTDVFNSIKEPLIMKEPSEATINNNKVFIVHGHDDSMKNDVARFIEKLDLEAIILHEQANTGLTIIEKIEKYSDVGYAIVLYSPCDVGAENTKDAKPRLRARQNVVFEHGYVIGKIGRNNVSALVKDNIETPGDVGGVIYINYSEKNWQFVIANELKTVGYNVDLNKL